MEWYPNHGMGRWPGGGASGRQYCLPSHFMLEFTTCWSGHCMVEWEHPNTFGFATVHLIKNIPLENYINYNFFPFTLCLRLNFKPPFSRLTGAYSRVLYVPRCSAELLENDLLPTLTLLHPFICQNHFNNPPEPLHFLPCQDTDHWTCVQNQGWPSCLLSTV